VRYFITFVCYGAHLHGEEGAVDPRHNLPGTPYMEVFRQRVEAERQYMDQAPYLLDAQRRTVVLEAIREVCLHRRWTLLAAHIRSTHVHVIVEGEDRPEKIMNAFKSYSSRSLNRIESHRKHWARHGSTRWLWKDKDVRRAIQYVVEEQGEAMAVFFVEGCV
jgi:REP element-mobilizing transposase RayT